jgi:hypothetical protein
MRLYLQPEADEDDDDTEDLIATPVSVKAMCYKTVEVFAGITQRKLWLKDSGSGACTDGHLIHVPLKEPGAYQYTEHELSHILFQSDGFARATFVKDYAAKVVSVAPSTKGGERALRKAMTTITGILDDERVISLWGLLYKGSETIMRRMKYEESQEALPRAHNNILTLFYCLAGGHEVPPGRLDRYEPYILEALRKVRLRDFLGVLVTSKWIINMLVGELIRQSRNEPPPVRPMWGIDTLLGSTGVGLNEGSSSDLDVRPSDAAPETDTTSDEAPEPSQPPQSETPEWRPPDVTAPTDERIKALGELIGAFGAIEEPDNGFRFDLEDVQPSKFQNVQDRTFAVRVVNAAIGADVKDPDVMEKALEASSSHMQRIVDKARQAVRNTVHEDDRIRQDAYAKVVFHDEALTPFANPSVDISEEDLHTILRLRAGFVRVMGRRANRLEDAGVAVDVSAFIERLVTGEDRPVFRGDSHSKGFKALILVDRSQSMNGHRTHQAERGCRIISRALKFPFVESAVWGFQSWDAGQVDITRFAPGMEEFTSDSCQVGGTTPLHTAVRVGVRHLEAGTEKKHLFVLSDGFPVYARKGGDSFATKTLMGFVRGEVQRARSHGIGVTGIMIGNDLKADAMSFMFGSSKHWRVMGRDFGNDLVQLITASFIEYLRSG